MSMVSPNLWSLIMFRRNLLRGLIVAVVSSVGGSLGATAEAKASTVWSFDKDEVGRAPAGFEFAVTAKKQPGKWVIVKDGDNHVLAQVDRNKTERRFAMALVENSSYKNLKILVKAKASRWRCGNGCGAGAGSRPRDRGCGISQVWQSSNDQAGIR
jgi:hypothetical protein